MKRMTRKQAMAHHPSMYLRRQMDAIWTPEDFDRAVADAQAVVEAGKRRLRVVTEDERGLPAFLLTKSRERRAKRMDAFAVTLLMAVAAAFGVILMLLSAPHAKADMDGEAMAYAAEYGPAVCSVLDEYPSTSGMLGIMQAIVEDGLTDYQAGEVVGWSIYRLCPEYTYLAERFVARYGAKGQAA